MKDAVKLLKHVVAIKETVLKEDYPSRLASQHALLSLYAQQLSDGDDWAESDIVKELSQVSRGNVYI